MEYTYIERDLQKQIEDWFYERKILILYGARQVGKTTLIKKMIEEKKESIYINCEQISMKVLLEGQNIEEIRNFFGKKKIIILDEAQTIKNIGKTLKLLVDSYPDNFQIVATGSSSFELANEIVEPLTGRNIKFTLLPLSLSELSQIYNPVQIREKRNEFLLYGMYPEVVESSGEKKQKKIEEIASDYLYQDVLAFHQLKKSDIIYNLLKALALQVGSEVSYHELSQILKTSSATVENYIDLLEKTFVIFRLPSLSRNLRKEIGKKQKIFFYDLGVRNSILQNFTPIDSRGDTGALWENFCIAERIKNNWNAGKKPNMYFWRTYDQKEIDYIEESNGKLRAFECKWNERKKTKTPKEFLETYEGSTFEVISQESFWEFVR